jgi:hypothetical protein
MPDQRPPRRRTYLPPGLEPFAVGRTQAALLIGVSPSLFDSLASAGKMPAPVRIGTPVLFDVCAIRAAWRRLAAPSAEAGRSLKGWD